MNGASELKISADRFLESIKPLPFHEWAERLEERIEVLDSWLKDQFYPKEHPEYREVLAEVGKLKVRLVSDTSYLDYGDAEQPHQDWHGDVKDVANWIGPDGSGS